MTQQPLPKEIHALFGGFADAYTQLRTAIGAGNKELPTSSTCLDPNDIAIVVTGSGGMQLFLPENGKIDDTGLALVEIYNALCRSKAGAVNSNGYSLPENVPFKNFISDHADRMKRRKK